MAKQKIADLPQEEQDKLISEMKELGIGGVYATYTVEKAEAAIAKKKAEKESGEDNKPEDEDNEPNEAENPDEQPQDEEKPGEGDEPNDPENPESSDEKPKKEPEKEPEKPIKQEKPAKKERKSEGICHICRSKVYDGVCSGCGFSLRS